MNTKKKITLLQRLLDQLTEITVRDREDPKFKTWKNMVERNLISVFGPDSPEFKQFQQLMFFDSSSAMIPTLDSDYSHKDREYFDRDFDILISSIKNYIDELQQDDEEVEEKLEDTVVDIEEEVLPNDFGKIFIPK